MRLTSCTRPLCTKEALDHHSLLMAYGLHDRLHKVCRATIQWRTYTFFVLCKAVRCCEDPGGLRPCPGILTITLHFAQSYPRVLMLTMHMADAQQKCQHCRKRYRSLHMPLSCGPSPTLSDRPFCRTTKPKQHVEGSEKGPLAISASRSRESSLISTSTGLAENSNGPKTEHEGCTDRDLHPYGYSKSTQQGMGPKKSAGSVNIIWRQRKLSTLKEYDVHITPSATTWVHH